VRSSPFSLLLSLYSFLFTPYSFLFTFLLWVCEARRGAEAKLCLLLSPYSFGEETPYSFGAERRGDALLCFRGERSCAYSFPPLFPRGNGFFLKQSNPFSSFAFRSVPKENKGNKGNKGKKREKKGLLRSLTPLEREREESTTRK
jgi:hypothetical protein